jgi:hypothetical protein
MQFPLSVLASGEADATLENETPSKHQTSHPNRRKLDPS